MTLKRTTDRLPRARYGERVEFAQGERETDYDADTEQWAVSVFEDLVRVDADEEDDYVPPERDATSDEPSIEERAARVVSDQEDSR